MQKLVDGVLVDMTQEEVEEILSLQANAEANQLKSAELQVRNARDQLLLESDWIVARSYERGEPVPANWVSYRQALRDITAQAGFPYSVEWPTKP